VTHQVRHPMPPRPPHPGPGVGRASHPGPGVGLRSDRGGGRRGQGGLGRCPRAWRCASPVIGRRCEPPASTPAAHREPRPCVGSRARDISTARPGRGPRAGFIAAAPSLKGPGRQAVPRGSRGPCLPARDPLGPNRPSFWDGPGPGVPQVPCRQPLALGTAWPTRWAAESATALPFGTHLGDSDVLSPRRRPRAMLAGGPVTARHGGLLEGAAQALAIRSLGVLAARGHRPAAW
jgi:hypothetical protein